MPRSEHRLIAVSTFVTVVVALAAALAGHVEAVAYAAPFAVLALPLLGGRYFGEERIARLAARRRTRPRLRAADASPTPRPAFLSVARGGLLIARSLAVRPPPVPTSS